MGVIERTAWGVCYCISIALILMCALESEDDSVSLLDGSGFEALAAAPVAPMDALRAKVDSLACEVDDLRADLATLGTEFDRLRESLTSTLAAKRDEAPGGEPIHIWITYAPRNILCAPCERLKKSIANNELEGFEIQTLQDTGRVTSWPAIEFTNKAGQRRILYGWSSTTLKFLKENAR